jgi:hypothetical protein
VIRVTPRQLILATVTVAVVTSVIGALLLVGPPSEQRRRRLDARRVQDLQRFAAAVDSYWAHQRSLPVSAEAVEKQFLADPVQDPESGMPYGYRVTGEKSFEVCATFATRSTEEFLLPPEPKSRFGTWTHDRGTWCFALEAQPERK